MQTKRQLAGSILMGALCLLTGGCMFGSKQTQQADEVARFTFPQDWKPGGPERQGVWSAFEFRQGQSWHFGAGNPLEVHGWVITTAAGAAPEDLESAMDFAFRQIQSDTRRFDEFGSMKTGTRTTWMSEGSYQISPGHDPEKVLFLRAIDPSKQVALVVRVYLRKIKHEKLRQIEHEFFNTFQYLDGRAAHFAAQPRPALAAVNRFLRERGFPLATSEQPVMHNGWVYYLAGDRFVIGRRLSERREGPGIGWLKHTGSKWESHGAPVPERWAYRLALDADRTKTYYFAVLACELDAACDLPTWFDQAAKLD